jgi:aspartate aminotransferase-like enzyme
MGYGIFAEDGYASNTVTCVANDRNTDVGALNKFLATKGLHISDGYGDLKGRTFRIAHMGDATEQDMRELFAAMSAYLAQASPVRA